MGPEDENGNPVHVLQLNLRANISDVTVHICQAHHMSLKIVGDVNILHLMCMQC